jgi:hypothetical protein
MLPGNTRTKKVAGVQRKPGRHMGVEGGSGEAQMTYPGRYQEGAENTTHLPPVVAIVRETIGGSAPIASAISFAHALRHVCVAFGCSDHDDLDCSAGAGGLHSVHA